MMKSALRCSVTPAHMGDCSITTSDFFNMSLLDGNDSLHSRTEHDDHSHSESSSSCACLKPPQLKSNVSFGKVDVRVYERVVEDSTYLGIGWQYNKDVTAAPLDAFEEKRDGHRRSSDELRLSAGERRRIAVAFGCEEETKKKSSRPMALSMI